MKAYVIYLANSPLEWQLDRATRHAVSYECPVFYGFPDRSDAESVLHEVPRLFDLAEEDALGLRVVEIELPI